MPIYCQKHGGWRHVGKERIPRVLSLGPTCIHRVVVELVLQLSLCVHAWAELGKKVVVVRAWVDWGPCS